MISLIALFVVITEIIAFLVIDFLFRRKESAAKLTDTRLSRKTLTIANVIQLVFLILGVLFIIDTWGTINALNDQKNKI